MKRIIAALFSILMVSSLSAQEKRASPLMNVKADVDGLGVSIQYGQPAKKGRVIFGELVPYGKIWRTGANEASVIEFSANAMVNGEKVKAGKYALFTIPGEKEWTIILNEVWNQWGAYNYDISKDVASFKVPAEQMKDVTENFTISISEDGNVTISWDMTSVTFEVSKG